MINFTSSDLHNSRAVVTDMSLGAGKPGVYCIFFDSGQLVLERSGYLNFDDVYPLSVDGFDLMYVGATLNDMRARLLCHLKGNSKASSLRMTIGALFGDDLGLDPVSDGRHTYFDFGIGEGRLTAWMIDNTKVAFIPSTDPFRTERDLMLDVVLPFNINERRTHPFSKHLIHLHAYIAGKPKSVERAIKAHGRIASPTRPAIGLVR